MRSKIDPLMQTLRSLSLGLVVWATCLSAGAGVVLNNSVVQTGGQNSGLPGQAVSLSITETALNGMSSADLTFSFDPTQLSFKTVAEDCLGLEAICGLWVPLPDVGGMAVYSLFLVSPFGAVDGSAQLLTLLFDILPTASVGDTFVKFENTFDFATQDSEGVYDRQSLSGTITVLAPGVTGQPVPLPGSALLSLTALALLAGSQRLRRTPAAARRVTSA